MNVMNAAAGCKKQQSEDEKAHRVIVELLESWFCCFVAHNLQLNELPRPCQPVTLHKLVHTST